jgi:hypothetical protein
MKAQQEDVHVPARPDVLIRRCAIALDAAREWLRKHPEDVEVGFAMLDLLRVRTREVVRTGSVGR